MALTLYGLPDAARIDELLAAANIVFAEYGAGGGPSLLGDDDEEEDAADAAERPPVRGQARHGGLPWRGPCQGQARQGQACQAQARQGQDGQAQRGRSHGLRLSLPFSQPSPPATHRGRTALRWPRG